MTKKDYIKIADVIKVYLDNSTHKDDYRDNARLIDGFCIMLGEDNLKFDEDKFQNYINKAN